MACYHFNAKTLSKGTGASAGAKCQYITRTGRYAGDAEEVRHVEAGHMPAWALENPQMFWDLADTHERKNGRLCKEIIFALPTELSDKENLELIRETVEMCTQGKRLPYTWAWHKGHDGNPHVHLMISERVMDDIPREPEKLFKRYNAAQPEKGGLQKTTDLMPKEWLLGCREQFAEIQNRALERAGHDVRVDHRSFADRGIALEPTIHVGLEKSALDFGPAGRRVNRVKAREEQNEAIRERNAERLIKEPSQALKLLTSRRATFTERHINELAEERAIDAIEAKALADAIRLSNELVSVGEDASGERRFTSIEQLANERLLSESAGRMAGERAQVSSQAVDAAIATRTLSDEQEQALRAVTEDGRRVAVIEGVAGAGKSYALGAIREAHEADGWRVVGGALSGRAAEGLQADSGIESKTLHSLQSSWRAGDEQKPWGEQLNAKTLLVIDEVGMVGTRQLSEVMARAERAGAKVILVGDREQHPSIEAGAAMSLVTRQAGQVRLEEVRRQREDWQREATKDFAAHESWRAFDAYAQRGHVRVEENPSAAIVRDWKAGFDERPDETRMMLAVSRAKVRELNAAARESLKEGGRLSDEQTLSLGGRDVAVATGERMMFTQNSRELGVKNGTFATVERLDGAKLGVRLDDGRQLTVDTRNFDKLEYGYATTVAKSQGMTVDHTHLWLGYNCDRQRLYVGMSRHRDSVSVVVDRAEVWNEQTLKEVVMRDGAKDNALDLMQRDGQMEKRLREMEREKAPEMPLEQRVQLEREMKASATAELLKQQLPERFEVEAEAMRAQELARRDAAVPDELHKYDQWKQAKLLLDAERRSRQHAIDEVTAFESQPDVKAIKEQLVVAERDLALRTKQWQFFKEQNPIKARTGLGQAGELRRELDELTQKRDALAATREAQRSDPQLLAKAQAAVAQDVAEIREARARAEWLAPHVEHLSAQREHAARLEAERADAQRRAEFARRDREVPADFAKLDAFDQYQTVERLRRRSEDPALTRQAAFERHPDVVAVQKELASIEREEKRLEKNFSMWREENPIKARTGLGRSSEFKDSLTALSERREALMSTADAQRRDPALLSQIDSQVSRDAVERQDAKAEYERLSPHHEHLKEKRAFEVEKENEVQKEQQKLRGPSLSL